MKLIREEVLDTRIIAEEKDGQKNLFIEGPFLQSEVNNRNGRRYPSRILEREVNRYIQDKINKGQSWGELGHPNGPGINLDRISHLTTSLTREGNDWIGRAKLVDTVPGNTAKKLMEAGGTLGVSSRGLGSLKQENGYQLVQDDFYLAVAADIVADPSAPNAFVKGVMEGVEFFFDVTHGTWAQKMIEPVREELVKSTIREIDEKKTRLFETFLKRLGEPLSEGSSLHGVFKAHGLNHFKSTDNGDSVTHMYVGMPKDVKTNSLHNAIKRKGGFQYSSGAGAHGVIRKGDSNINTYRHEDGSKIVRQIEDDGHTFVFHTQKIHKESVIFETEMTQIALSVRTGIPVDRVASSWNEAKRINEIRGNDEDDFESVSRIMNRLLGLA